MSTDNIAAVPVKTSANQNYFLKNVSRFDGELEIIPVKCDFKLRLKDVLGDIAKKDNFVLQKIRVHRIYFKVDKILMEYPSSVVESEKVKVLMDMMIGEEDIQEKLFMVTIPDSRTGEEVVRMMKLVYDKISRVAMLLPENVYQDWIPIGFEVSFAG
jgi:hypothetical protein